MSDSVAVSFSSVIGSALAWTLAGIGLLLFLYIAARLMSLAYFKSRQQYLKGNPDGL